MQSDWMFWNFATERVFYDLDHNFFFLFWWRKKSIIHATRQPQTRIREVGNWGAGSRRWTAQLVRRKSLATLDSGHRLRILTPLIALPSLTEMVLGAFRHRRGGLDVGPLKVIEHSNAPPSPRRPRHEGSWGRLGNFYPAVRKEWSGS